MIPTVIIWFWSLLTGILPTAGTSYYVSAKGDDMNKGTSPSTAWKSLERVSRQKLRKQDKVLLEGGSTFNGTLKLDEKDAGDAQQPVWISTYGIGKATIAAEWGTGIEVRNTSGVHIQNLVISGNGVGNNKASGIDIYTDNPNQKMSGITIEQCEVSGFHFYGIVIQSSKSAKAGFHDVKIANCICYSNGEAGIGSLAFYPSISHSDFYLAYCKTFNNRGILTKTDNHSGNGIVLSGVDHLLVEYCEASENGVDCRSVSGGPVGIWLWNCRNGLIQNCVSHHNHSGTSLHDGGGFDIDGGSSDCTIQQCLSYSNEGAGYLVCEFGSPNKFTGNKILDNTSRNDGLKNNYGAITVSGAGPSFPVTNTLIRNNTVVVESKNVVSGIPSAIFLQGADFSGIQIEKNRLEISGSAKVLRCDSLFTPAQASFENNLIHVKEKGFPVDCFRCGVLPEKYWSQLLQSKSSTK